MKTIRWRRWGVRVAFAVVTVVPAALVFGPLARQEFVQRNETEAIAALYRIGPAQYRFKTERRIDRDGDGAGEFGYLQQLSEAGYLDAEFGQSARDHGGTAVLRGYRFRVFLPKADGAGLAESVPLPAFTAVDADPHEDNWVVYAWPDRYGWTGHRSFMTNAWREVPQCPNVAGWSGDSGPRTGAEAFFPGTGILGPYAIGGGSADGQTWTPT